MYGVVILDDESICSRANGRDGIEESEYCQSTRRVQGSGNGRSQDGTGIKRRPSTHGGLRCRYTAGEQLLSGLAICKVWAQTSLSSGGRAVREPDCCCSKGLASTTWTIEGWGLLYHQSHPLRLSPLPATLFDLLLHVSRPYQIHLDKYQFTYIHNRAIDSKNPLSPLPNRYPLMEVSSKRDGLRA